MTCRLLIKDKQKKTSVGSALHQGPDKSTLARVTEMNILMQCNVRSHLHGPVPRYLTSNVVPHIVLNKAISSCYFGYFAIRSFYENRED